MELSASKTFDASFARRVTLGEEFFFLPGKLLSVSHRTRSRCQRKIRGERFQPELPIEVTPGAGGQLVQTAERFHDPMGAGPRCKR